MSTSIATQVLLPEQKATRELVASLLDAKFNLPKYQPDAEAKLEARRDAVVREFAKANSADATLLVARNLATAIEQFKKDQDALEKAPKLVTDCLDDLKKKSPDDFRAVLEERKAREEAEINKSASGRIIYEEHLKFLEQELKGLPKPKGQGRGGAAAPASVPAATPAAPAAGGSVAAGVSTPVAGTTPTVPAAPTTSGSGRRGRKRRKK